MTDREQAMLVEETTTAWRAHTPDGRVLEHPAWADLPAQARVDGFEEALVMRVIEAGLDPAGFSTTVRAVLSAIRSGRL
jgi:hypothetical protein